jgi:polynucleotide 5'-kinase involved in rRNA processing
MSSYQIHTEMNDDTGSPTVTVTPRAALSMVPELSERTRRPSMILVLGGTGTGKSSFVATVSGKAVGIGHDLRSCQSDSIPIHGNIC